MGVATPLVRVDQVPLGGDAHSWVLTSEATTVHNAEAITRLKERGSEGDVVVRTVAHVFVWCDTIHTIILTV